MGSQLGICHICLEHKPLTYEHVPPKRAYNHHQVVAHMLNHPAGEKIPMGVALKFRGGMG